MRFLCVLGRVGFCGLGVLLVSFRGSVAAFGQGFEIACVCRTFCAQEVPYFELARICPPAARLDLWKRQLKPRSTPAGVKVRTLRLPARSSQAQPASQSRAAKKLLRALLSIPANHTTNKNGQERQDCEFAVFGSFTSLASAHRPPTPAHSNHPTPASLAGSPPVCTCIGRPSAPPPGARASDADAPPPGVRPRAPAQEGEEAHRQGARHDRVPQVPRVQFLELRASARQLSQRFARSPCSCLPGRPPRLAAPPRPAPGAIPAPAARPRVSRGRLDGRAPKPGC